MFEAVVVQLQPRQLPTAQPSQAASDYGIVFECDGKQRQPMTTAARRLGFANVVGPNAAHGHSKAVNCPSTETKATQALESWRSEGGTETAHKLGESRLKSCGSMCLDDVDNINEWLSPPREKASRVNKVGLGSNPKQESSRSFQLSPCPSQWPSGVELENLVVLGCSSSKGAEAEEGPAKVDVETRFEKARIRANTTNSMSFSNSICRLDPDEMISRVSTVIECHLAFYAEHHLKNNFALFIDRFQEHKRLDGFTDWEKYGATIAKKELTERQLLKLYKKLFDLPDEKLIRNFIARIYQKAQLVEECILMSLVYLEKLLKIEAADGTTLLLHRFNWKPIIASCLILASKMWDDLSMSNKDFSLVLPQYGLKKINEMEVLLLKTIGYDVRILGTTYAKYYFVLHSLKSNSKPALYISQSQLLPKISNFAKCMRKRRTTLFDTGRRLLRKATAVNDKSFEEFTMGERKGIEHNL